MSENNTLPTGWAKLALKDCGTWYGGGTPSKANASFWSEGHIPWVSPKDMKVFRITDSEDHISSAAIAGSNVKPFPPSTVLVVIRSGILNRTLPVAIAAVEATMNQDMKGIKTHDAISSEYLAYFLRSEERRILRSCSKNGTTVASIDTNALHSYPVRIAPLPEQRRIVSKLEELLSELDAGVAALKRVQVNLKRYRSSVLKAAVEGRLTEAWRAENHPTETGSELLTRILKERRRKWEDEQVATFAADKKEAPKNWQARYKEADAPIVKDLPSLPVDWCWATIDQLRVRLKNGYFQSPTNAQDGIPILRINAVRPMKVDLTETRFLGDVGSEVDDYCIEDGDLLFTRYNGSIDLLGVAGMVRGCSSKVVHPDKLIRVCLAVDSPLPNYVEIAANVGESRRHIASRARTTAGQTGISGPDVREMPLPLPPLAEQAQIVNAVDQSLSSLKVAEIEVERSLARGARLRQSILKMAFEGKLVAQDAADEPASALLARIHQQRLDAASKVHLPPIRQVPSATSSYRIGELAYIVQYGSADPHLGRKKAFKECSLGQHHLRLETDYDLYRMAFGPYDTAFPDVERQAVALDILSMEDPGNEEKVSYRVTEKTRAAADVFAAALGDKRQEFDRLLRNMGSMNSAEAELFATAYAAWNDLLIDGRPVTDDAIIDEIYGWHAGKRKFKRAIIRARLDWMRQNGYVPTGQGVRTRVVEKATKTKSTPRKKADASA